MIKFIRDSKHSIQLKFDILGANRLIEAFNKALMEKDDNTLQVDCLEAFGKKKCSPYLTIMKGESTLSKTETGGVLSLEEGDLEYGKEKLLEAIEEGYIEPAEFTRIMTNKSQNIDELFWELLI